jgi:AraC-like DNA-binding protein
MTAFEITGSRQTLFKIAFMNSGLMFYREAAPAASDVSHLVLSFWEFAVAGGEIGAPIQHEVFPDGCVSVFYHRNENFNIRRIFLSGLQPESIKVPVFASDIYWGMRISPAAGTRVLRSNPSKFQRINRCEAEEFPHLTENLLEKLDACRDFAEAVNVYEKRLRELNFNAEDFDEKIAQAIAIIEENNGEIKIAELAGAVNLGVRQLERRFKNSSGLTPKQYARTRRLRATAVSLVENENLNWANRAAAMGFTDQAHLNHEFVSVTGRSPNSFAEKVKQIEHGNLV